MGKMSLRNKSLKVNSRKTLAIALTIALAMATLGVLLALAPAKAQGTITLSSANLHRYKVIEITVSLPGVDVAGGIDLRVTDTAGQPRPLAYRNGSGATVRETGGFLKAARLSPGVYVAYLGGYSVNQNQTPMYPKTTVTEGNMVVNIARLNTDLDAGDTIVIEALGYGISTTVTYDVVKPASISFDRTEVPARRTNEYTIRLTVVDQDLNLDPTKVDTLGVTVDNKIVNVTIKVTWISGTTGITSTKSLNITDATIKESTVNSGSFVIELKVSDITPLNVDLTKGDTLLVDVSSNIGWGGDVTKTVTGRLTVVYRYPEVSVSFTQQGITISITSPDDNVKTYYKDKLDPSKTVTIKFGDYSFAIGPGNFTETDKNTGVFQCTIPVEWGAQSVLQSIATDPRVKVVLGPDTKSFTLSATYLYITGSGTYTTASPEVTVVKASPVNVILLVKDKDINVDPKSIDRLDREVADNMIKLKMGTITLYEVSIKKPDGTMVIIPSTINVTFFETDFDSGEFRFTIPSREIPLEAGKSYTIVIKDHTGGYTIFVPITISPVKIELDRSVYPINRDSDVVVYITYVDDRYNANPAVIEDIPTGVVKYKVVNPVTGIEVLPETNITAGYLKETGPDTGIFTGKITIRADAPKYIDAKIIVYTVEDVKAEAVFKVYQLVPGDLKVEPASINITGSFKITVYDPDANVDSKTSDRVKVNVMGNEYDAYETGANTATFTVTVRAKDLGVKPGATITVKYTEKTPSLSPTATTFAGSEYDITATVKVVSFTGFLVVPKDWIGPYEIMKIKVKDPDLNVDPEKVDVPAPTPVKVTIEGRVETYPIDLKETDVNTGEFSGELCVAKLVTGKYTPYPEEVAGLIGKKVTLVYLDEADAAGAKATQVVVLTVKAFDAEVTTDKAAVNLGESFKIIVSNPDIAENPAVDFRKVIVRSTTYPAGVTLYASEVKPGVYEVTVTAVSLKDWVMGAPQIPAKLGDTITIEYMDPIAADGKSKLFAKTIVVGVPVERPVPASEQKFLDVTGAEKKVGKVGETVMLSTKVQNVDVVDREFTAIFQVKDERGAVVYIAWVTAKLAPGTSMTPAVSWTPTVAGTYTVEVLVVKSIAEPTPYSDKISAPFTVQ